MELSRVDTRARSRDRRRRRLRRLLLVNACMLLAIAAMLYGLISEGWLHRAGSEFDASAPAAQPGTDTAAETGGHHGVQPDNGPAAGPADADSGTKGDAGGGGGIGAEPAPADEAIPEPDPEPVMEPVKLAFVGDILLASSVEKLMRREGFDYPYAKALSYLQEPDLTIGNLENPITTRGVPAEDKQYVFKGSPDLLPSLLEAGFDFVSLANNHTLDQGVEGLLDTMDHLNETGIAHAGAGRNDEEAFKPAVFEVKGMSIAVFGLSRVVPWVSWKADKDHPGVAETYDPSRAVAAIARAREAHDLVIVYAHWGEELKETPRDIEKKLARAYIDAGADLVVGAHPHVLQGFEYYEGGWIAYSLGNFIFNVTKSPGTRDTGVLHALCTKDGGCELTFHPMRAIEPSQPAPLEGGERLEMLRRLEQLSFGVAIDEAGRLRPAPADGDGEADAAGAVNS